MSTALRQGTGPLLPPPAPEPRDDKQLRRDRWTAVIVVTVMALLLSLIIWLASISGVEYDGADYWNMMP